MQALKEAAEVAQASIELNKAGSVVSCNAVRWPPSTLGQDKKEKKRPGTQSTHLIADVFNFMNEGFFYSKVGQLGQQTPAFWASWASANQLSQTCCLQIEISKKTAQALIACSWDHSASNWIAQYDFSQPHFCNHNCCQLDRKSSNKVKFEQRQEEEKEVGFGMFCRYEEMKDPAVNVMNIQNPVIYCSSSSFHTSFITKILCRKSYSQKVMSRVETIALQQAKRLPESPYKSRRSGKRRRLPTYALFSKFPVLLSSWHNLSTPTKRWSWPFVRSPSRTRT